MTAVTSLSSGHHKKDLARWCGARLLSRDGARGTGGPSGTIQRRRSRHSSRPSPAAISSSLLLIPGGRGGSGKGAQSFCAPLLWVEHDAYNRKRRSPRIPWENAKAPVEFSAKLRKRKPR